MSELNGTNFNFNPIGKNIQPKMVENTNVNRATVSRGPPQA